MTSIPRALPEPLLTDDERDEMYDALSLDDCGHVVAFVSTRYPAVFDAALAALGRYPTRPDEVA